MHNIIKLITAVILVVIFVRFPLWALVGTIWIGGHYLVFKKLMGAKRWWLLLVVQVVCGILQFGTVGITALLNYLSNI